MAVTGLMFEEDKQYPGLTYRGIDAWEIPKLQGKVRIGIRKAQQVVRDLEGGYISIGEVK